MGNRFASFLILLVFFIAGFFYFFFSYLPKKVEQKNEKQNETIQEEKDIFLSLIEKKQEEISSKEKIEDLKEKQDYFEIFNLNGDKFYFSLLENKLNLYLEKRFIGVFDFVEKEQLKIEKVYSSEDFYISIGNKKNIYNKKAGSIYFLDLNIDINYIKKSLNKYLINTQKGTFIYSKNQNKIEYFNFFDDFVYYNNGYLGIIERKDDIRIKNLAIKLKYENAIFYYNPDTKEKKIVYETNKDLNKIYLENGGIYFEDMDGSIYLLENY